MYIYSEIKLLKKKKVLNKLHYIQIINWCIYIIMLQLIQSTFLVQNPKQHKNVCTNSPVYSLKFD